MFYIGGSWVGFLSQEVENVKHGCLEQKDKKRVLFISILGISFS